MHDDTYVLSLLKARDRKALLMNTGKNNVEPKLAQDMKAFETKDPPQEP